QVEQKSDRETEQHARHTRTGAAALGNSLGAEIERNEGDLLHLLIVEPHLLETRPEYRLPDGTFDLCHVSYGRRVRSRVPRGFSRKGLLIHDDVPRLLLAHHLPGRKALRLAQLTRSHDLHDRHSSRNCRVARDVHCESMAK